MIHEESEDRSFRVSQLEKNFKGNMEKKMDKLEESMERIVNIIQHP